MPFTYAWSDCVTLASKMVKGIPTSTVDAQVCDMVSGEMYKYAPWQWTVSSFGATTLVDGQQDYSAIAGMYRLLRARITRTDTTPNQFLDLNVRKTLAPDLTPISWTSLTDASNEEGVGLLRLNRAVSVPTGVTLLLGGEYQVNPTKITATSQALWFPDEYLPVAAEGLLHWYYRLADDPRAGSASINSAGKAVYSGQLGQFMAALEGMAEAETYPATLSVFPDDALGEIQTGGVNIFGV